MGDEKQSGGLFGLILLWLSRNRLILLIASVLFCTIMFLDQSWLKTSQTDRTFGSLVLVMGLVNFTYWTLLNKQVMQEEEKVRIKGRRKR